MLSNKFFSTCMTLISCRTNKELQYSSSPKIYASLVLNMIISKTMKSLRYYSYMTHLSFLAKHLLLFLSADMLILMAAHIFQEPMSLSYIWEIRKKVTLVTIKPQWLAWALKTKSFSVFHTKRVCKPTKGTPSRQNFIN